MNSIISRFGKVISFVVISVSLVFGSSVTVLAAPKTMEDGTVFDAEFYAQTYPDVAAGLGTDEKALYNHYVEYGRAEGRKPTADSVSDTIQSNNSQASNGLCEPKKLANYKSLKKKLTDAEFQAAYDVALVFVAPLKDKTRSEQLVGIASVIRYMVESGLVVYSTSAPHYNDPYGYFVSGVSSCAGCARATGLCLNILGIPYEHVNENQWSHQWCRVPMEDGSYWICDAYGLYCGPEPAPYQHPYIQ